MRSFDSTPALVSLGWNPSFQESFTPFAVRGFEPGRVAVEDKHRYLVLTASGELNAHATGRLLHEIGSLADLPKVGDWVALSKLPNEDKAVIHGVLPRQTKLSRKVPGRLTEEQILATNIDTAFIVQALDGSFNPRLIQRHLVMVREGGSQPIVVLNKADLCAELAQKISQAEAAAGEATVVAVSAKTGLGMESLAQYIRPGWTIVFLGSSGVGKSTLINQIYGDELLATTEVRASDCKGRHTTSWRELIVLPNGGLVIDTPGLREFHLWTAADGLDEVFQDVEVLALGCRFRDCTHTVETKCAVLEALGDGRLSGERYRNYVKLKRELAYLEDSQNKRSHLERKRHDKFAQRAFNKLKRRRNPV